MTIECISPIDGSTFATRETLSRAEAVAIAGRARTAQVAWAARPLAERIALVRAGVAALGAMNEEIVPELARQMGRPIRYGGEFGGVEERATYMAGIAETALAPVVIEDSRRLPPLHRAGAARARAGRRPLELPLHDGDQHGRPGAHRR